MEEDPSIFLTGIGVDDFRGIFATTLEASPKRTGRLVLADTSWASCGVAANVAALVVEQGW